MFYINEKLDELARSKSNEDVVEVVPLEILRSDEEFFTCIIKSNEGYISLLLIYLFIFFEEAKIYLK